MKNTQISLRQCGIIIAMCIFANKILLMPSLMFENSKSDSIFVLIFLFALDFIALPIFLRLKKHYPTERLYDILKDKIGVFVTKLIFILLIVFFFFKCLLVFSVTYVYFKNQIYHDEFIFLAFISFLPVISHAAIVGIRAFSRTMELFFFFVIAGFIVCLCISLFTPISMPYFFTTTAKDFFTSTYNHIFSFGDFAFLFLVIDRIKISDGEEKSIYKYAFFSMLLVLILYILFFAKYQITAFMHNNALADMLVFSVQFNAIGRLDIIAMITIMLMTVFQMEIFSFAFCECFQSIFPLLNRAYAIVFFDILFCVLYYVFVGKYENVVSSVVSWLPVLGMIVSYLLPILFWIISYQKRRGKIEKTD